MRIFLVVEGNEPVEVSEIVGKVRNIQVATPYGALGRMDCSDLSEIRIYVELHAETAVFMPQQSTPEYVVPQLEETVASEDAEEELTLDFEEKSAEA